MSDSVGENRIMQIEDHYTRTHRHTHTDYDYRDIGCDVRSTH